MYEDLKKRILKIAPDGWTLDITPMMPESRADRCYGSEEHRLIAELPGICLDLIAKLSDAEKANAEMLSKVMTVNSENIALQSDLGTAEKKLSAANAEIKRLKKYIKSLTTDTFHNPNEI
jgi:hypothetical protein